MPTTLYLLRHGPTAAPAASLVGSSDPPLSGRGLERLTGLADRLENMDQCWCSPMLRTRQTLDRVRQAGSVLPAPCFDERLREIDFGRWEGRSFIEIAAADPALVKAWQEYEDFCFPQGETVSAFVSRVGEMLDLFSGSGAERIFVVTHGGVIRTMICLALGLPVRSYLLFDVQPASLAMLDLFDRGGVLKGLNL